MMYEAESGRSRGAGLQPLEACYGSVECCVSKGAFLRLDNGESAFAYGPANLREGVKVLCTVRRPSSPEQRAQVMVDAVLWDEYEAA